MSVLPFFSGMHEPVARGMGLEDAGLEVHLFGQAVAVAARLDDLAGQDEFVQRVLEVVPVLGLELEQAHQFAHHHGLAGPGLDQFYELFVGVFHNLVVSSQEPEVRRKHCYEYSVLF